MTAYQDRAGLWHITSRDDVLLRSILRERAESFTLSTGNLRGAPKVRGPLSSLGRLPADLHYSAVNSLYMVYSYETPIAWFDAIGDMWFVPCITYSTVTSRHLNLTSGALCGSGYSVITSRPVIADHRRDPRFPQTRDQYGYFRRH